VAIPLPIGMQAVLRREKIATANGHDVTIQKFQKMMHHIFFERDTQRGAEGTFKWLEEEVGELGEELRGGDRRSLEDEFADVFAWLASLANVLQVNLAEAALRKYDGRCPRCHASPCACLPGRTKG
jgi:NTP pyrophosphatase (non-canonical NTP hydrolase)